MGIVGPKPHVRRTRAASAMTSRERVLATLAGKAVDRVASDFRAEPEVFLDLQRRLGLPDAEAVRRWAKSDFRDLTAIFNTGGYGGYSSFGWRDRDLGAGVQEDLWGVRRRKVEYDGGAYVDIVRYPLRGAGVDGVRRYSFPDPRRLYDFRDLPARVKAMNGPDAYFTLMEGESLFDRCWALRGMEDFMMDLADGNEIAHILVEKNARFFRDYVRQILEAAHGSLDAIGLYNDLGTQDGMMISPALYRRFFKDRQRELIAMIHGFGVKVFYHSCGDIEPIIEDLIEIGIDILDPLQLKAMRRTPAELGTKINGRITLHGGLDTQDLLVNGLPDQVTQALRELKRELGRQGRYILSCSHYLQVDVPFPNIEALVSEVN
jgi:uroporphyrinogen decarboxylase